MDKGRAERKSQGVSAEILLGGLCGEPLWSAVSEVRLPSRQTAGTRTITMRNMDLWRDWETIFRQWWERSLL